jgi:hypothetical protein
VGVKPTEVRVGTVIVTITGELCLVTSLSVALTKIASVPVAEPAVKVVDDPVIGLTVLMPGLVTDHV